jgi:hypothetical protein
MHRITAALVGAVLLAATLLVPTASAQYGYPSGFGYGYPSSGYSSGYGYGYSYPYSGYGNDYGYSAGYSWPWSGYGYPSYGYPSVGVPPYSSGFPSYGYGWPSYGWQSSWPGYSGGSSSGRVCILIYPPPPGC